MINGSEGEEFGGSKPGVAWRGRSKWEPELIELGVKDIIWSPAVGHTREEADAFLKIARERRWKRVAVLTQPHHLPRVFLGMLKAMEELKYSMQVYGVAPKSCDWNKVVRGSQGAEELPRVQHLEQEFDKIQDYQEKGDLATLDEMFEYLEQREEV